MPALPHERPMTDYVTDPGKPWVNDMTIAMSKAYREGYGAMYIFPPIPRKPSAFARFMKWLGEKVDGEGVRK